MTYMRPPTTMSTKEVARQLSKYYASKGSLPDELAGLSFPSYAGFVIQPSIISRLCKAGRLRAKKVGGEWQIREEDAAKSWPHVFDAAGGREG